MPYISCEDAYCDVLGMTGESCWGDHWVPETFKDGDRVVYIERGGSSIFDRGVVLNGKAGSIHVQWDDGSQSELIPVSDGKLIDEDGYAQHFNLIDDINNRGGMDGRQRQKNARRS